MASMLIKPQMTQRSEALGKSAFCHERRCYHISLHTVNAFQRTAAQTIVKSLRTGSCAREQCAKTGIKQVSATLYVNNKFPASLSCNNVITIT